MTGSPEPLVQYRGAGLSIHSTKMSSFVKLHIWNGSTGLIKGDWFIDDIFFISSIELYSFTIANFILPCLFFMLQYKQNITCINIQMKIEF